MDCIESMRVRVPYVQELSGVAGQTILVVLFFKTFHFILVDSQQGPTVQHKELYVLPGSSVQGILQARILEGVAISFSRGIFSTQGLNVGLLHCR